MLLIAGVDPGLTGAIAIYDRDADKLIGVWDIPTVKEYINGRQRRRLDMTLLRDTLGAAGAMGVKLLGIEKVQGWGGKDQSASAAFQFGYVYGKIESAAEIVAPVADVRPDVWKMREKVPSDAEAIVKMASEAFPEHADRFVGPKGGPLHDRAEAALLARYFARRVWPTLFTAPALTGAFLEVAAADMKTAIVKSKIAAPKVRGQPRAFSAAREVIIDGVVIKSNMRIVRKKRKTK